MDIKDITKVAKGLNISTDREIHIIFYVDQMIKDYRGSPIDIIKEININLRGDEKYFAVFVTGYRFNPIFSMMKDIERTDLLTIMADVLAFSDKDLNLMSDYIKNTVKKDMEKKVPIIDIIKGIINSKFTDKEKGYLIFVFTLVLD